MGPPYVRTCRVACVKLPYFALGALPCCMPAPAVPRPATLPRVVRRLACLLCVLGIAGLLTAGVATAAEPVLPLGTDGHGVHLRYGKTHYAHRELVLTFDDSAAALFQQVAGRRMAISCIGFDRRSGGSYTSTGTTDLRAPHRRKPIATGFGGRFDVCVIGVRRGRRTIVIARIPLTPFGAVQLDERNVAIVLVAAVRTLARPERPSAATVAATFHGVALATPADTPPPGVLGVYSDGADHVYAAEVDRSGKLLFVELERDVTRSNVVEYLLGEDLLGID